MDFHLSVVPEGISLLRGMRGYLAITKLLLVHGQTWGNFKRNYWVLDERTWLALYSEYNARILSHIC